MPDLLSGFYYSFMGLNQRKARYILEMKGSILCVECDILSLWLVFLPVTHILFPESREFLFFCNSE